MNSDSLFFYKYMLIYVFLWLYDILLSILDANVIL